MGKLRGGTLSLAHGAGGKEMGYLLDSLIMSRLPEGLKRVQGGLGLDWPDDAAAIPVSDGFLVVSVDSYTVNPPFFPGGDIGSLAVSGTINDILMLGARPLAMLDAIVAEEGLPLRQLEAVTDSLMRVLREEGIPLIGGDFKTMPKGQLDKIIITTVGLGHAKKLIIDKNLSPGDKILATGYLGDHGATILALQQGIQLEGGELKSDAHPLTSLLTPIIERYGDFIHAARDPTRGGVAMTLNDWAKMSGTVIIVDERIPMRPQTSSYAGMLGLDSMNLASEGAAILGVDEDHSERVLEDLKRLGSSEAAIIGEVRAPGKHRGLVLFRSSVGGLRILEPPSGELVPRIC